jgi:hypothetical protein
VGLETSNASIEVAEVEGDDNAPVEEPAATSEERKEQPDVSPAGEEDIEEKPNAPEQQLEAEETSPEVVEVVEAPS